MSINIILPGTPEDLADRDARGLHPFSLYNSSTRRGRPLSVIVAVGRDGAIGRDGGLIWRIPADLKRFRQLTMGHAVIMGRRTWQSLPKGALPGRRNIVLTRDDSFEAPGAETAASLADALALCAGDPEPFVIGGAQVYAQALPHADRLYLTLVDEECADADARLEGYDPREWRVVSRGDTETTDAGIRYSYIDLARE